MNRYPANSEKLSARKHNKVKIPHNVIDAGITLWAGYLVTRSVAGIMELRMFSMLPFVDVLL